MKRVLCCLRVVHPFRQLLGVLDPHVEKVRPSPVSDRKEGREIEGPSPPPPNTVIVSPSNLVTATTSSTMMLWQHYLIVSANPYVKLSAMTHRAMLISSPWTHSEEQASDVIPRRRRWSVSHLRYRWSHDEWPWQEPRVTHCGHQGCVGSRCGAIAGSCGGWLP